MQQDANTGILLPLMADATLRDLSLAAALCNQRAITRITAGGDSRAATIILILIAYSLVLCTASGAGDLEGCHAHTSLF